MSKVPLLLCLNLLFGEAKAKLASYDQNKISKDHR